MKEVSNHFLLFLAIIAISVTFIGVWISLTTVPALMTGEAVGQVNVTINETVGITLQVSEINFTLANPGDDLESNDSSDLSYSDGYPAPCSATDDTCNFNITNDGSVPVNITMTNNNELFNSTGLNSTHYRCSVENQYNTSAMKYGYCTSNNITWFDCSNNGGATNTSFPCITNLNYTNNYDSALVRIRIMVPGDEPSGHKSNSITFTGAKA